jgi:hypothetical protein
MKASELRIGNLIKGKSPEKKVYEEPVELNEYYFLLFLNNMMDVEPIPLTEEWLLNFGFTKQDYTMSGCSIYKLGNIIIMNSFLNPVREYMGITIEGISPPTWSLKDLNFVHQLQNLYYELTGEELTIKNK